ncbi:TetR family transcriptional regulator [Hydrogenispora ethanolica]|uniref:TetR family transcriptional regulator n=1 Tax=Hydrogenispora ethanolica TaxID=1082276 RepID=A0A4R1RBZ3_HYDET|nr:TetR/AcrR family transcriptional regulator [Hydrogenispora ethanolica]TCL63334.1 TetR family transcriptional regulator [Hydrogenispora ethanolica]
MYIGNNPSALRSREEIVQAFLRLLEHTSLEKISIKQIMDATDLSRQTFYQIFDSKEEILEYYLDDVFGRFITGAKQYTITNLCDAAKLFFSFFDQYKATLQLFIQNGKSCVVQRKCREFLQKDRYIHYELQGVSNEQEKAFAATFVISGMVGMLEQWIREDQSPVMDADDLALLVCHITNSKS